MTLSSCSVADWAGVNSQGKVQQGIVYSLGLIVYHGLPKSNQWWLALAQKLSIEVWQQQHLSLHGSHISS